MKLHIYVLQIQIALILILICLNINEIKSTQTKFINHKKKKDNFDFIRQSYELN